MDLQCPYQKITLILLKILRGSEIYKHLGCFSMLAYLPSVVKQYRKSIWTTKRLFSKQRITRSYQRKQ